MRTLTCFICGRELPEDETHWVYFSVINKQVPECSDDRNCEPSMEKIFGEKKGLKKH